MDNNLDILGVIPIFTEAIIKDLYLTADYIAGRPKFDINTQDIWGRTILHRVAHLSQIKNLEYLKKFQDLNPNVVDNDGITAFMMALRKGCLESACCIKIMKGFDYDININNNILDLDFIVHNKNIEIVKYLEGLKRLNVNKLDNQGHTPFIIALIDGNFELAQYISTMKNFDPNAMNTSGESQLMICCKKKYISGVKILLSHKDFNTLNIPDVDGNLPIKIILTQKLSSFWWLNLSFNKPPSDSCTIEILKELLKQPNIIIPNDIQYCNNPNARDKEMMQIIKEYKTDPITTRHRLKLDKKLDIYRLVVLTADGYFDINSENDDLTRFMNISIKLPNDLQMLLINRMANSPKDIINSKIFHYEINSFINKYTHMKQEIANDIIVPIGTGKTYFLGHFINLFDTYIDLQMYEKNKIHRINLELFEEYLKRKQMSAIILRKQKEQKKKEYEYKNYSDRKRPFNKFMIKNMYINNSGHKKGSR